MAKTKEEKLEKVSTLLGEVCFILLFVLLCVCVCMRTEGDGRMWNVELNLDLRVASCPS